MNMLLGFSVLLLWGQIIWLFYIHLPTCHLSVNTSNTQYLENLARSAAEKDLALTQPDMGYNAQVSYLWHHRLCPAVPPQSMRRPHCRGKFSCGKRTQDNPYVPAWLEESTLRQSRNRGVFVQPGMCRV